MIIGVISSINCSGFEELKCITSGDAHIPECSKSINSDNKNNNHNKNNDNGLIIYNIRFQIFNVIQFSNYVAIYM